jgi:hypothetical protein
VAKEAANSRHLWACDALDEAIRHRHLKAIHMASADLGYLRKFIREVESRTGQQAGRRPGRRPGRRAGR